MGNDEHSTSLEFAELASAFCAVLDNAEGSSAAVQIEAVHRLLPRLYAAALSLPASLVPSEDDPCDGRVAPNESGAAVSPGGAPLPAMDDLIAFLGPRRFYREIFDPYSEPTEAEVAGDIIDDLNDIYRDLSAGLKQWRAGHDIAALWEWRFSFETHWAEHVTSALRALFALSAWRDVSWPAG